MNNKIVLVLRRRRESTYGRGREGKEERKEEGEDRERRCVFKIMKKKIITFILQM